MFKKILIANRGEIAVRILRTCREMGVATVVMYQAADCASLHVRLADECVPLESNKGFLDREAILRVAREKSVDAIHPGYGFLAEQQDFIRECNSAGFSFIGPPAEVVNVVRQKIKALERARAAGFLTPAHSSVSMSPDRLSYDLDRNLPTDMDFLWLEAERLGYPLVVKSSCGGRGRGEHLVMSANQLENVVRKSQTESLAFYGERQVYLEKAILPAHQIGVQVMGDQYGNLIHLGEREGSLIFGNQKIIEESPSPSLTQIQRESLWRTALDLGRLFEYQNVGTVEFLLDQQGQFYFTEIKPRIQIEHPLTEMISRIDLIRHQILLAAGQPLSLEQSDVHLNGWAMQCRISAEDPLRQFLPNPGRLQQLRLPGGIDVRTDTYVYDGSYVPVDYDPLIAKLIVWAPQRDVCVQRLRQALQESRFVGIATNLPFLQRIMERPTFIEGSYASGSSLDPMVGLKPSNDLLSKLKDGEEDKEDYLRDLSVAAVIAYFQQNQAFHPHVPDRLRSGWHRQSRLFPG